MKFTFGKPKLVNNDIVFPPNDIIATTAQNKILGNASEVTAELERHTDYLTECIKIDLEARAPKKKENAS